MVIRSLLKHEDLLLVTLFAFGAVFAVLIQAPPIVRLIPALPLVFYAPGHVLVSALFPPRSLPALERLLMSVGGSIAITILVGLSVAVTPFGLGPVTWTVALASITVLGVAVAWLRRRGAYPGSPASRLPRIKLRDGLPMLVAGVGTVAILIGTRTMAADQEPAPPAQLWLLPGDPGSPVARLGMRADGIGGDYTIRLTSAGLLLQEFAIRVDAEGSWERDITLSDEARRQPIVGRLYDDASDTELRFVVLQPPTN